MSCKQKLSNFGWLFLAYDQKTPKKNWASSSENGCAGYYFTMLRRSIAQGQEDNFASRNEYSSKCMNN
ncbi:hypothetical protein RhiirA5_442546 [Rhizophagus irregularis]|uniref:Uncharacterized protein n=1 Tax=Rhizophagus irregularis TaxID=588596 RepID=A0A2N0NEN7_9GLOM|nr:hypothetical protein RhiirA5_442546 [Rhizophagus irregularis]